jgi:hypothetical protein
MRVGFEFWTTGAFSADALACLESEKPKRTRTQIDWKDGTAIHLMAKTAKEKAIGKVLDEHFFKHPLRGDLYKWPKPKITGCPT